MAKVIGARLSDEMVARLAEASGERPISDLVRDALDAYLRKADVVPSRAATPSAGNGVPSAAPGNFSDNPAADRSPVAGEKAQGEPGVGAAADAHGNVAAFDAAAGQVASLREKIALALAGARLAPEVNPELLLEALAPLAAVSDDGAVLVTVGDEVVPLFDAVPPEALSSRGGPGGGGRSPGEVVVVNRPHPFDLALEPGGQAAYEKHRAEVLAENARRYPRS